MEQQIKEEIKEYIKKEADSEEVEIVNDDSFSFSFSFYYFIV